MPPLPHASYTPVFTSIPRPTILSIQLSVNHKLLLALPTKIDKYVMYKPWPRGVYVRYTPAVRNLFVIFPEGQRPEGYITNKLPNIAGVYLKIYTDWTWFIRYMLC